MKKNNLKNPNRESNWVNNSAVLTHQEKERVKIKGTSTSSWQLRNEEKKESHCYAFFKLNGQNVDLSVIFKNKDQPNKLVEPTLKKGQSAELTRLYYHSGKSICKSFTAYPYQIVNHE